MELKETEALVILSGIPLLGPMRIRQLLKKFGSAIEILKTDPFECERIPGFGPRLLQNWKNWKNELSWRQNFKLINELGVTVVPFTSPQYPKRLLEIADHPIVLYIMGDVSATESQGIAIVGTRQASVYGSEQAELMGTKLGDWGYTIISGLARGIDTAAHRGALKKGKTIAVIGSGLADIYPAENRQLAKKIAEQGAVISEYPMLMPPDRQNFPQRNRIVSALSQGVVLIEAPLKSGAMLTMEIARQQKKICLALPGRVDSEGFRGNHFLIKEGYASLVEGAEDVTRSFGDLVARAGMPKPRSAAGWLENLSPDEKQLWQQLPTHELTIDEIAAYVQVPIMKLNVLLISLVMKKAVKEFPGKIYQKAAIQEESLCPNHPNR